MNSPDPGRETLRGPATRVIEAAISASEIAGAAVSVRRNGRPTERSFSGHADLRAGKPIAENTMFRLASMTKPVIAVAVMQLVESGRMSLDDPVSRFIPAFAHTTVRDLRLPLDASFKDPRDPEVRALVEEARSRIQRGPAQREVTVRDLLTHSSGLGQGLGSAVPSEEAALRSGTLAERVDAFAAIEGDFQPGEKTGYSGLVGFDILGRIIEVVSGADLEASLRTGIFDPLGMDDTTFCPTAEQRSRMASVYERRGSSLAEADTSGSLFRTIYGPQGVYSGAGGLYGTLHDYECFAQMLADDGALHGVRMLQPETVERLVSEEAYRRHTLMPGMRWGLGVAVVTGDVPGRAVGSWGWSGAFGTHFCIDPANRLQVVIMVNQADIGGASSPVSAAVERALLQESARRVNG